MKNKQTKELTKDNLIKILIKTIKEEDIILYHTIIENFYNGCIDKNIETDFNLWLNENLKGGLSE